MKEHNTDTRAEFERSEAPITTDETDDEERAKEDDGLKELPPGFVHVW